MGKPRKDSWKKLGLDLAKERGPRLIAFEINGVMHWQEVQQYFIDRARALRKGANRGKA